MTAEQFAYWLQGYAELNATPPSPEQWQMIREHLATVFHKVTPPLRFPDPQVPYRWPTTSPFVPPLTATCSVATDETAVLLC